MIKRILLADDHIAVRKGLKAILIEQYPQYQFGETTNSQQTIQEIRKNIWDMVILDVDMPGRDGFEVLKQIQAARLKIPVLVCSYHVEEHYAIRALRAGAAGFLPKNADGLIVVNAVRQVLAGKKFISETLAQCLVVQFNPHEEREPYELLSDRELQVLNRIAHGLTVTQIASELSLSLSAISSYRRRILDKMQMRTNAELVNYSIKMNLI